MIRSTTLFAGQAKVAVHRDQQNAEWNAGIGAGVYPCSPRIGYPQYLIPIPAMMGFVNTGIERKQ
jgi:hypothetical protein